MTTISVLDAVGATQVVAKVLDTGQAAMAASLPVVLPSNQSPVPFNLVDGISAAILAAIKAASTAPLATDPALVTAESPNSPLVNDMFIIGQATQTASGQNILLAAAGTGPVDTTGYRSIALQIVPTGTVSSGVVTFEASNDQVTYQTIQLSDSTVPGSPPVSTTSPATGVSKFFVGSTVFRYFRARISTVIGGGGSLQAFSRLSQPVFSSYVQNSAIQVGGNALNTAASGSSTQNLGVILGSAVATTDYTAQAWAAASGNGATITSGFGNVCAFDVNLSAFTAGASTGLDIFLQWSPDNATWYDLWQCEALTATGHVFIPPIFIPGRRRMRWVNRGGAATTATVTVTAMQNQFIPPTVRQWFDRTANLLNGTATTASAAYDVVGCPTLTATVVLGAATTPGSYQLQISNDGTNWASIGTATAAAANAATAFSVTGVAARFARVICTVGATAQTGTYVAIAGCS